MHDVEKWLSIIVPVYNIENYLDSCIKSILQQMEPGVEVLLINDGSKDNSGKICDFYAANYENILVIHKSNGGLSDARNFGIKKADGDYLLFLDGDDRLNESAIENIKKKIKEKRYDVIIGRYQIFHKKQGSIYDCDYFLQGSLIEKARGEKLLQSILSDVPSYNWYAWLNIINREYLIKNDLFFKEGVYYEDTFWTPQMLMLANAVGYMDYPFYIYTLMREGAITTQINQKTYNDKIKACLYIKDFCDRYLLNDRLKHQMMGNYHEMYSSLIIDIFVFEKRERNKYWNDIQKVECIWRYSPQKIHVVLYYLSKIVGMKLIAGFLYVMYHKMLGRK